jgi:hypothetical protein
MRILNEKSKLLSLVYILFCSIRYPSYFKLNPHFDLGHDFVQQSKKFTKIAILVEILYGLDGLDFLFISKN